MPISTPPETEARYSGDSQHFTRVARHLFGPAAEAAGFEFRAPSIASTEIIQAEIIRNLENADLVLCDVSTWNANVFFELGIRVALDKPVVMVKDNHTPFIPFDNAMVNCYTYDSALEVWRVEEEVPKLAAFIEGAKMQDRNALWKYFGITQRAEQSDLSNPEEAKLELVLREVQALRGALRERISAETGQRRYEPTLQTYSQPAMVSKDAQKGQIGDPPPVTVDEVNAGLRKSLSVPMVLLNVSDDTAYVAGKVGEMKGIELNILAQSIYDYAPEINRIIALESSSDRGQSGWEFDVLKA